MCSRSDFARRKESPMLDLIMLAFGLALFVVSVGYVYACERL
jgi:hypothetical protein